MTTTTGHHRLLEQLRTDGVRHLFGNPGSTEEALLDEHSQFPDLEYVLGLQEAAVVCMADGYAQATGQPATVLLHSGVGLGNAVGSLYHAMRRHTPMVVLVGEAGMTYDALEAHMAADLVGIAKPVTKYAARATHPANVLRLLRRCRKVAATPPAGPVVLAVPQDVLDQPNDELVTPSVTLQSRVRPDLGLVEAAADLLAGATSPLVLVGDGVPASGAVPELVALAETWGAGVYTAMASELVMPWTHPLYRGSTGHMFGVDSAALVAEADAVLVCGTYVFPEVFALTNSPFRDDARIVHIDLDAYAIAQNHPVTLGIVSDPQLTLRELTAALGRKLSDEQRAAAAHRVEQYGAEQARSQQERREQDQAGHDDLPLRMSAVAEQLSRLLPEDAAVFDEALTNSPELTRWLPPRIPGNFFQTPGGTLGVGIPGAVGVKAARPDQTVVGVSGDGGAMYTFQALWTAAHSRIGAKFVVCHNSSYRLLKQNLYAYRRDRGEAEAAQAMPACFDVSEPAVDFVRLAESLGVPATQISKPSDVEPGLRAMLDDDGPHLVEAVLERGLETE